MSETPHNAIRKLLMVSYWYPPAVGAAAERADGFARFLPQHGWIPHVLTAAGTEPTQTESLPAKPLVHRVPDPLATTSPAFAEYDPRFKPSRLKAILREALFPDRFFRWQRAAYQVGLATIRQHAVKLILSSFPPASAVLLGLRLHEQTAVPLILDFRDRWLGPGGYEPLLARSRRKHAELEREAVAHSAGIVVISAALAEAVVAEHGCDRRRIFIIPNGYEPGRADSTPAPPPVTTPARLTFAHVGTVIQRNRPDLFFESVTRLAGSGQIRDVAFRFVGNLSRQYLSAAGLTPFVESTGLVSRQQALNEIRNTQALLLLTGKYVGRWGHNAKIFEYIRAGRPILCLEEQPGSNDRRLLEQFAGERSFFAPINDPRAIAQAISQVRDWLNRSPSSPPPMNDAFEAYDRRRLAATLAAALDAIAPTA